jgi:hypothetical protein
VDPVFARKAPMPIARALADADAPTLVARPAPKADGARRRGAGRPAG